MVPQRRRFLTASIQYMTPFTPSAVQAVVQVIVVWSRPAPTPRRQPGYGLDFATVAYSAAYSRAERSHDQSPRIAARCSRCQTSGLS
jgi:hypothetical protein